MVLGKTGEGSADGDITFRGTMVEEVAGGMGLTRRWLSRSELRFELGPEAIVYSPWLGH